jgi:hypothetical protein
MNAFCVVVTHVDDDWALVLSASRTGDQRYFTPFVFAFDTAGLFSTCPDADIWARQGLVRIFKAQGLSADARKELLENAVADTVQRIHTCARVFEHKKVGLVQRMKASAYTKALPGFSLGTEHAYCWLYEHKKGEQAVAAMKICRYLADKHKIGALSIAELEAFAEAKLLNQKIGGI